MRFILPILFIGLCTVFFSSSITTNQVATNLVLVDGEKVPVLPELPFNYEDQEFPEHLIFTGWGDNDSTVLDIVTNEGATLGRVLFYDELLSANENLSCGTCHKQALSFADDSQFSQGVDVETKRNSMHLNDLGWSNNVGFFWDMSQSDLKDMIALPLENENEIGLTDLEGVFQKMNDTEYYPQLFTDAFGSTTIDMERIQHALMQFISSMTTFDSKLDKAFKGEGSLTETEVHGMELFEETCGMCHVNGRSFMFFGAPSTSLDIMNMAPFVFSNGLPIEGGDIGAGEWEPNFEGLFKPPTLRNIELTAPYMHDGRFETLEEVLEHYNEGVEQNDWQTLPVGGLGLSEEATESIIAFMKTMTDDTFTSAIKFSDPFNLDPTSTEEGPEIVISKPNIYPNPSNGWTSVQFENPFRAKVEVLLNNMQGQMVRKMSTNETQLTMDVSQLAAGTYYVTVKSNGKKVQEKLVVQ